MIETIYSDPDFLEHHGVKGMKWGVRRYQNYDGSRIKSSVDNYNSLKNNRSERSKYSKGSSERYESFIKSQPQMREQLERKAKAEIDYYNAENDYDLWEKDYDAWLQNSEEALTRLHLENKKYDEAVKYYNSEERQYLDEYMGKWLEQEYPGQFVQTQKAAPGPTRMWGSKPVYTHKATKDAIDNFRRYKK